MPFTHPNFLGAEGEWEFMALSRPKYAPTALPNCSAQKTPATKTNKLLFKDFFFE